MTERPTDVRVYDCGRELQEGVDFEVIKIGKRTEWNMETGVFKLVPEWGFRLLGSEPKEQR